MTKINLSVATATYNEEHNIKEFLDQLSWLNQIVIVDGNSTDNTVKIAKKYKNVKVIQATNKPIFHINKQMAIDACMSDWILQLDADERVSTKLKKEIISIVNNPDTLENAFWINRRNWFLCRFLKKGGQYPDSVIRLFKKGKGRLPCISVHEQVVVEGKIGHLKNDLLHYADTSFSRYLTRNNRYTALLAQELVTQKKAPNPLSFLILKPFHWFLLTYIRHKGFVDGFPGLIFSWYSSLRFPISYIKYLELKKNNRHLDLKQDWS